MKVYVAVTSYINARQSTEVVRQAKWTKYCCILESQWPNICDARCLETSRLIQAELPGRAWHGLSLILNLDVHKCVKHLHLNVCSS